MKHNRMKGGCIAAVALLGALGVVSAIPAHAATKGKASKSTEQSEIAELKRELAEQRALINKLLAAQSNQGAPVATGPAQAPAQGATQTAGQAPQTAGQAPAQTAGQTAGQTPSQAAAQAVNSLLPKGFTMYGRLDVSLANSNSGFGNQFTVGSAGMTATSLGLKGQKELAYGLSLVGNVEMGIDLSTGVAGNGPDGTRGDNNNVASSGGLVGTGNQIFSRQAYAGLASDTLGQLTLGRQYSGSYLATAMEGTAFGPGFYGSSALILPVIGSMPTRVNNAIVYQTPAFDGFLKGLSVYATYTAGSENNLNAPNIVSGTDAQGKPTKTATTDSSGEGYDLAVFYRRKGMGWEWNGESKPTDGLTVGATAWTVKNPSYDASDPDPLKQETGLATREGWQALVSYDFGLVKLYSNYVSGRISGYNYDNVTKKLSKAEGWSVSAKVPFLGKHAIIANYSQLNDRSKLDQDANILGVAYTYEIVKDTWLYASWGQIYNNKNGMYSLMNGGDLVGSVAKHPGYDPSGLMLGVNTKL